MAGKPQQQIPGVSITGVKPDTTRQGTPIFKVQTSDGQERSTFDQGAATKAMSLVNQIGTVVVELNGQYQNYVDFIPGGAGTFPAAQTFPQQFPQQGAATLPVAGPVFQAAPDGKEQRIIRGNSLNAAAAALGPFISTGFFVNDEGKLLTEDVGGVVIKLAKQFVGYLSAEPDPTDAPAVPALPAGVTPDQVAAWAASLGAPVAVGVDVAAEQDAAAEAPDKPY